MSSLETAQSIWETSTKIFDKIDKDDKKEWFNSLIDQIEENDTINRLKKTWDTMTEEQKLKIYNRHSISIGTRLRYASITTFRIWEKYATIEEIPCRFLVELGILNKPQWLTNEKLKEDIKSDAKNFDTYLWICEATCAVFDETKALVWLIAVARHYTKWYKKEWTNIVIERLNKKKKNEIEEQTNKELAATITDIKDKKKAA